VLRGLPSGADRLIPHRGYHGAGSAICYRSRRNDALRTEKCDVFAHRPNIDQHATGRETRGSSTSAPTGVLGIVSACTLSRDRDARGSQLQLRLAGHAWAARASAAADRSCSCRRISASTSIVKKLCITAPVLLHHDSVDRTWQRKICEVRKRGESSPNRKLPATPLPALYPEDRARRRQCRERVRVSSDSVGPGEERDGLRNQPGKLIKDPGAILDCSSTGETCSSVRPRRSMPRPAARVLSTQLASSSPATM
jgi:hypothetical protein